MTARVLFLCTGNVCRSPMAEGMLRRLAEEAGHPVAVESAGVGAGEGIPPSGNSVLAMDEEGIDIRPHRSRQVTSDMVEEATHIFGMATSHADIIRDCFPEHREKVFVLREFVAEEGLDRDVSDPIGGDLDEYRIARNLIKEAMPSVLRFVLTGDPAPPRA